MAMVCSPRTFSHLGVTARLPEIQHPLSRLGDPETISVRGVSREGNRNARLGKVITGILPDYRSKSALTIQISPRRDSKGPMLEDVLRNHGVEQLDSWKKLDQWVNLDIKHWKEGRRMNENESQISSRPGTQVSLQTDELVYLIQEKIKTGGFYTLKQLFQANDPTGRGHVTRDVLKIILTKFLGRFITEKQFGLILSRLQLKDKPIITFEKFHLCFRMDEVKGYPLWMDPVGRQQTPEKKTAVQVHLQLKETVRDRPLEFMNFLPKDDRSRISGIEFLHILYQMGILMEDQEFETLWKRYDKSGVGTVKNETLLKTLGYKYSSENEEQRKCLLTALSKVSSSHLENQTRTPRRGMTKMETERKLTLNIEKWLKEKMKEGFKDILAEFQIYDQERTGKVTKEAFLKVLQKFYLCVKEEQLNLFLARCGLHEASKHVPYTDFLRMFQDRSDQGILQKVICDAKHRFHKTKNKGPKSTISALESGLLHLLHSDFLGLLHAFQTFDTKKMDAISPKDFRNIIEKRCLKMTDEEFQCLLQKLPLDKIGNVKYVDFMARFDNMSQNPSILDDNKTLMTTFTKKHSVHQELGGKLPCPKTLRPPEQLSKMIKDLLKNNFNEVEMAFSELDSMNTRRLSMEMMYQLLKRLNMQPSVSRDEISELWKNMISNQDKTVTFLEFTRHFGFSPKSACYLNAKVSPPVKGDGDFLIRSRKLNSDTEITENKLKAKVAFCLDDVWAHFQEMDPFNSGFVTNDEFRDVLTELCPELSEYQFEMISNKFCRKENQISYVAFLQPFEDQRATFQGSNSKILSESQRRDMAAYSSTMQKGLNAITSKLRNKMGGDWKTLLKACKKLDVNNTGYLLLPEFRSILKLCNVILDENEVYHIMAHFDKDMAGKLDYSKFIEEAIKQNK